MKRRALLVAGLSLACAGGCRSLERFDTKPGHAYCGSMVSAHFVREGLLPANLPPNLLMRMHLDTDKLSSVPATITTGDVASGLCAPRPLFENAPLRAIEPVMSDPLSLLEFGEDREHNFLAWVDSSCTETMLAVVSLMKDDSVELRLLKPAPLPASDAGPDARPGFGVFKLRQQAGDCGF